MKTRPEVCHPKILPSCAADLISRRIELADKFINPETLLAWELPAPSSLEAEVIREECIARFRRKPQQLLQKPVGVQLIGNYLKEGQLLNVAHRLQQVTDFHLLAPSEFA